jgi:hypothetical protein
LKVGFITQADGSQLYHASYAERPRDEGSDVEACFSGHISLCRLHL